MIEQRTLSFIVCVNLLALTACTDPASAAIGRPADVATPIGIDLGGSSRAPSRITSDAGAAASRNATGAGSVRLVADARSDVAAVGVINSIDAANKRINLSHQPIPAIGWPAMTMDFPVASSVDLGALKPGNRVNVTLGKGADGMYRINSVQPSAGR